MTRILLLRFLGVPVSSDVISAYGLVKSTNGIVANETQ